MDATTKYASKRINGSLAAFHHEGSEHHEIIAAESNACADSSQPFMKHGMVGS
jgi:hypothetical protein